MVLSFHRVKRLASWLRLLPALAWIAVQLSMTTMPVAESEPTHEPEIAALFEALGVERIVLCMPDGKQVLEQHGDHASHEDCPWCQGFSVTVVPDAPGQAIPAEFVSQSAWMVPRLGILPTHEHHSCHPGRAPPALI